MGFRWSQIEKFAGSNDFAYITNVIFEYIRCVSNSFVMIGLLVIAAPSVDVIEIVQ